MSPLSLKTKTYLKLSLIGVFFLLIAFFSFFLFRYLNTPDTLNQEIKNFQKGGEQALSDLNSLPSVNLTEEGENYIVEDTLSEGIQITYPNQENKEEEKPKTKVSLPKDYTKPIEIKLDDQRIITIQDENNTGYTSDTLQMEKEEKTSFFSQFLKKQENTNTYLRYQNDRKTLLYSYQRDRTTGERKLKNWTFYQQGNGEEKESYKIDNAKIQKNENGDIELFFQTEQDLKNQAAAKEVDPSLMDRAMRTLEKEGVNQNQNPDLLIPRPYYYDKDGNYQEAEWEVQENKLILNIKTTKDKYPLSVDPTLAFTAPGVSSGGVVIESAEGGIFGRHIAVGDLNADGKTDLVVGATSYSAGGRAYIFYNDGQFSTAASSADVIITSEASGNNFGRTPATGDLNADGKTDLIVGASGYSSSTGRAYIFYNDGSYPAGAASADVIITGENTGDNFSYGIATGDLNADARTDLVIGGTSYSGTTGRAYVFYNDGSIPTTAATADAIITGEAAGDGLGITLSTGDLNADGKTDLIMGASGYSSSTGRAYIFYNGSITTENASGADVIITGEASSSLGNNATGDLNADGRTDLVLRGGGVQRIYIFYNDGSIPTTAATADVIIDGEASSNLGFALTTGDLNADGRTDLVAGAYSYSSSAGRVYVFYNDGSIPTTAATADVIITGDSANRFGWVLETGDFNTDGRVDLVTSADLGSKAYIFYSQNGVLNTNRNIAGEATGNQFGYAMAAGDLNADGRADLAVGAFAYSSNTGRAYIFYNDGSMTTVAASADVIITGETISNLFGVSLTTGDLNADGKIDLVVGAYAYATYTGRAYIFYNDGSIPTTAATADVIITGETTANYFGASLTTGDLNADGRTDLAAGAIGYSSSAGRVYVFYDDGSVPTTAATADAIITGQSSSALGSTFTIGDFNADGEIDLAVGAYNYSSGTGRGYIFYNGSIITESATGADVIITGESSAWFGYSMTSGDLNADGRVDLIISGGAYSSAIGRAYIFYNGSIITESATGADVIITGTTANDAFGSSVATGDLNRDGRVDLIVAAQQYSAGVNTGRVYIFYNDSSIPTTATTADATLTGEATGDYFGQSLTIGDLNADGNVDLVVGAGGYSTQTGRVYVYSGQDNYSWTLQQQPLGSSRVSPAVTGEEIRITGQTTSEQFGRALAVADLNADGKKDLIIGTLATVGQVYIFYNDGNYPTGATSADVVIGGETGNTQNFGAAFTTGDFNLDGKEDLAVTCKNYSSSTGRTYIFYNDGSYPSQASGADIIITGESNSSFGTAIQAADFNSDGKIDLVVGAEAYSSFTGRAYIFYNDGSIPTTAATADVTITGEATSNFFGSPFSVGDLNSDGRVDLVVGAVSYSSGTGRVYIFYNDGSYPTTAATADVIITGEASSVFGRVSVGDMNADGRVDLVVGAGLYSSQTGRVYIFYNDGSIPTAASSADVIITGESSSFFGGFVTTGDFNTDGKTDLAVGGGAYSSGTGRVYIFYNDGSIPTTAATADAIITGETSSLFGESLISDDFNNDGRVDLVVGAYGYSSNKGRVYIYTFNDSVTTGGATGDYFGGFVTAGDLNADGKIDLVVGARSYSSSAGRAYIFYGGSAIDTSPSSADVTITGEASSSFGAYLVANTDFNADGKIDLVVGSWGYTTNTGRAYIFYNDGSIPTTAATADIIITGAATSDYFGIALATGDLNADGKSDLVVGANGASKTYIYYNDGSIPTTAATADITITGGGSDAFGTALATGDMNTDGEVDLIVSALNYSTNGGAFIFYNDGSIPTTTGTADVTITGESGGGFGFYKTLVTGDFNTDGDVDLAVGAYGYSSSTGRAYIFYNDGSIPTTGSTADIIITASTVGQSFGDTLTAGDLNGDSKTDLVVGSWDSSSLTDNVYVFYNDSTYPSLASSADKIFSGSTTGEDFGLSMMVADMNIDGNADLVVGSPVYSSSTGRVYTFMTETVATAVDTKVMDIKGGMNIKGDMIIK